MDAHDPLTDLDFESADFDESFVAHARDVASTAAMLRWSIDGVEALAWPTPNPLIGIVPTGAVLIVRGLHAETGTETSVLVTSTETTTADALHLTVLAAEALHATTKKKGTR